MAIAKIVEHQGYPAIEVDGKVFPPMMAAIRPNNERILDKVYYAGLGKGGIKIFYLLCDTEWSVPGAIEAVSRELEDLIKLIPDAYVIMRIGLHPPDSWIEENPDECFTYQDGSKPGVRLYYDIKGRDLKHLYSLASQKWRNRAGEALLETCDALDKHPNSDRIIGYFFAAGGTSEWYYSLPLEEKGKYGDYSEAFKREFSKLLKEKYGTVDKLREAWKDETVTFENPKIYGMHERFFAKDYDNSFWFEDEYPLTYTQDMMNNGSNIGNFLDVDQHMGVFDFYRAWHLSVADSQIHFARLIREKYGKTKITGSFYGSYGATDFFGCTAGGVLRILDSGYMDLLAAPGVYFNRQPGGFTGQREMNDSFRLRNTMFVVEEDTRTHMELPFFKNLFDYYKPEDAVEVLKRDFGRNISEDLYAWWYDNDKKLERYKDEHYYNLFAKQQEIAIEAYQRNRIKGNEIAFIYDEESISLVSHRTTVEVVELFRNYEIARIGAGVDQYYHNDMSHPKMPDYKLYVFFNTFALTDEERKSIKEKLKKNNAVALWIYAPGIINLESSKKFDVKHMSELIGINMIQVNEKWPTKFQPHESSTLLGNLNPDIMYGSNTRKPHGNILVNFKTIDTYVSPLFYADDKNAKHEAYYLLNGYPAVTSKFVDGFYSIYHGAKMVRSDFIREVAKFAGVHIYSESEDVIYVNNNYLTIHASTTGTKKITFKTNVSPYEVYENKYYGKDIKTLEFYMKKGKTLMFRLDR